MADKGESSKIAQLSEVELRIYKLTKSKPKGLTDNELKQELPDISAEDRVSIINKLSSQHLIVLFKQVGGSLIYKAQDPSNITKVTDNEEKIVYSIIEKAGNKGIWVREIRYQSNLIPNQLNKILKSMQTKKLIKAVKSVAASKKLMYMLYNLEPDRSITGGAWYTGSDFESEFVEVLNQQCYRYLQQKYEDAKDHKGGPIAKRNMSYAKSSEVTSYINELGISKQVLSSEDIETILETIVYDGKVERSKLVDGSVVYRSCETLLPPPGFVQVPCGVCPVIERCNNIGLVTPKKCVYLKEWLEF